jgi:hypothetical protein
MNSATKNIVSSVNLSLPPECLIYVENQFDEVVNEKIVAFLEKHKKEAFAKNLIYIPEYAKQFKRTDITTTSVSKLIFNRLDYTGKIVAGFLRMSMPIVSNYRYEYYVCDDDFIFDFDRYLAGLLCDIARNVAQPKPSGGFLEEIFSFPAERSSQLRLTSDYEFVLADYNNLIIKEMTPLYKAVYLLFLIHEDGIRLKSFSDFKPDLLRLYKEVAKRNDYSKNINTIENLCNPADTSYLNQTLSKINKILKDTLPPHAYETFAILGERGMPKRIALNRNFCSI